MWLQSKALQQLLQAVLGCQAVLLYNGGCMQGGVCPASASTREQHALHALPYEPSLARALGAHERAVRRGPDPV
jgi:hypothetical protein